MSDNSKSLGQTGRVVNRGGEVLDDGFSNGLLMAGNKRSVRDRLGTDSYNTKHHNKRQRGESFGASSLNDMRLGQHDLRFKLMQKSMSGQLYNNDSHGHVDLRDKLLSKASRISLSSKTMHPPAAAMHPPAAAIHLPQAAMHLPQAAMHLPQAAMFLPQAPMRLPQAAMPPPQAAVSGWQPVLEHMDMRTTRHPIMDPRDIGLLGRFPSSKNTCDLPIVNTGRTSSSWNLDNIRRRSPERLLHPSTTRRLSPERNREEFPGRPSNRQYDDRRSSSLRTSPSRPVRPSFRTRSSAPVTPHMKSAAPFTRYHPQTSGIIQKTSKVDQPSTVENFLRPLGLEQFAIIFRDEKIDMNSLRHLGDRDLKHMGIPMGARQKILESIIPRHRRHM